MEKVSYDKVILSALYAETLGSICNGFSSGHVKSHVKTLTSYPDMREALRDHIDLWKKPGLYTSLSQLTLLFLYAGKNRVLSYHKIKELLLPVLNSDDEIEACFRHPDKMSYRFLDSLFVADELPYMGGGSSPILYLSAFSLGYSPKPIQLATALSFLKLFTFDADTVVSALCFERLLRMHFYSKGETAFELAFQAVKDLSKELSGKLPLFFEQGFLPNDIEKSLENLENLILLLKTEPEADEAIKKHFSLRTKMNVTRLTIDIPPLILIYVLLLSKKHSSDPKEAVIEAALGGGTSGVAAALCGLLLKNPDELLEEYPFLESELVNKKSLHATLSSLVSGSVSEGKMQEFLKSERRLSAKEIEEQASIAKHNKKSAKKKAKLQNRQSQEEILSRHVVESWTKEDKARWRRERRRQKNELEE